MIKPPLPFSDDWCDTIISEATLKSEDLALRITDAIKRSSVSNETWVNEQLIPTWQDVYDAIAMNKFDDDFKSDAAVEFSVDLADLVHYLFDLMNTLAPVGCVFESHEGDGACFGFFRVDAHVN